VENIEGKDGNELPGAASLMGSWLTGGRRSKRSLRGLGLDKGTMVLNEIAVTAIETSGQSKSLSELRRYIIRRRVNSRSTGIHGFWTMTRFLHLARVQADRVPPEPFPHIQLSCPQISASF
jgi:hypothetical protein